MGRREGARSVGEGVFLYGEAEIAPVKNEERTKHIKTDLGAESGRRLRNQR